ncbi:MAG: hypothetical protein JO079_02490 [Frankiaceae bacterium]|nr:hypothetical protein [Frankiaceae bacterium]
MSLRSLDESWLPRLARRAHHWRRRTYHAAGAVGGPRSPAGHAARTEPALAGSIAAVVIAALLVAIFGPHDPYDHDGGFDTSGGGSIAPPQQTLGPQPGASVSTYLTSAAFDLRHFFEVSRGKPGYALVSLKRYVTPAEAARVLGTISVTRAYVRVPNRTLPTSIYPVSLLGNFENLAQGMQSQSRFAGLNAKTYAQIVAGFKPKTDREKQERLIYGKLANAARFESVALATPQTCGCVFALLVHADYLHLLLLTQLPDVRAVDPAPPAITLDQLSVLPLRPDFTTVVPRPGVFGVG